MKAYVAGDGLQCESTYHYLWYLDYKLCCSEIGIQPMPFGVWIWGVRGGFPK